VERAYAFGDNPRWFGAGAADAVDQVLRDVLRSVPDGDPLTRESGRPRPVR